MKTKLLFILFCISIFKTFSQDLIAVQNGSTPKFYEDLKLAIKEANNGDTLYLPSKNYIINDTIKKELHFVGTGINPKSTFDNRQTVFTSTNYNIPQIVLGAGADNGSIIGIRFTPNNSPYHRKNLVTLPEVEISNYHIEKSNISAQLFLKNSLIKNNIIGRSSIYSSSGTLISNNIFNELSHALSGCDVFNNIFLDGGGYSNIRVVSFNDSNVKNNIFTNKRGIHYSSNNRFNNNLNQGLNSLYDSNVGFSNYLHNKDLTDIFVEFETYLDILEFKGNFHLKEDSPYKNAGTDGKELGIYGGRFPWKDGSLPFNPQITLKEIPGTTDENGKLNIKIEVEAQKN